MKVDIWACALKQCISRWLVGQVLWAAVHGGFLKRTAPDCRVAGGRCWSTHWRCQRGEVKNSLHWDVCYTLGTLLNGHIVIFISINQSRGAYAGGRVASPNYEFNQTINEPSSCTRARWRNCQTIMRTKGTYSLWSVCVIKAFVEHTHFSTWLHYTCLMRLWVCNDLLKTRWYLIL